MRIGDGPRVLTQDLVDHGLVALLVSFDGICPEAVPRSILILDDFAGAAAGTFYAGVVSAVRTTVNRDPSNQFSIFVEHLDFNRFRGPEYEVALNTYFAAKYKGQSIGVIVVIGTGALQYILRARQELWPAVPIVFTFVDPLSLSGSELPAERDRFNIWIEIFRHGHRCTCRCTRSRRSGSGRRPSSHTCALSAFQGRDTCGGRNGFRDHRSDGLTAS